MLTRTSEARSRQHYASDFSKKLGAACRILKKGKSGEEISGGDAGQKSDILKVNETLDDFIHFFRDMILIIFSLSPPKSSLKIAG